ncbi:MAG: hypothetical protein K2O24_09125 [Muribaculaceae bacterium]|nr:hypothetical protein [Muribaculaceae bacterium]
MENLSQHINFLLSRHDCVILPGVGAFIVSRRPARYNESTGRWLPPTRHIGFNSAVRNDDGLLAHSFSRRMHVDFEQARKELDLAISHLLGTLRAGLSYSLGQLGELSSEEESRIIFRPACTPGRRQARVGLHAFSMPQTQSLHPQETTMQENDVQEEIVKEDSGKRFRFPFRTLRRKALRVAAVCAAVAIGAASLLIPKAVGTDTQLASVVPVPSVTAPAKCAPAAHEATQEVSPETAPTAVISDGKKYHLIVATFSSAVEAESYISSHTSTTPESTTLYTVAGRSVTRVAAAAADNRETLLGTMRDTDFAQSYPGAWIWEEK